MGPEMCGSLEALLVAVQQAWLWWSIYVTSSYIMLAVQPQYFFVQLIMLPDKPILVAIFT